MRWECRVRGNWSSVAKFSKSEKEGSLKSEREVCCGEWVSDTEWERQRKLGEKGTEWESRRELEEKGTTRIHIKHMEGCPPGIEIKFVSLSFHLNKIESNGFEFNITELKSYELNFYAYVDEISISTATTMWDSSLLYSILHCKIKFLTLKLSDC